MTIQRAREVLGKKAEKLSDKEIIAIINFLTRLANKAIDDVVFKQEPKLHC